MNIKKSAMGRRRLHAGNHRRMHQWARAQHGGGHIAGHKQ